jgi:predicted RNase H-like HicB family nuclease
MIAKALFRRRRHSSRIHSESEAHQNMNEIIFLITEAPEGGYGARALGESIFTEADSLDELRRNVRDAVDCHFEDGKKPGVIRLHFVREEVLAP